MKVRLLASALLLSSLPLLAGTVTPTVIVTGAVGNETCPGTSICNITVSGHPILYGMQGPLTTAGITTNGGGPFGYPMYGSTPEFPIPIIQSHVSAWTGNFFAPLTYFNVKASADLPSSWGNIEIYGYVLYTSYLADGQILHSTTRFFGDYVDVNDQQFLFNGQIPNNVHIIQHTPGDPLRISYSMPYSFGPWTSPAEQDWFDLGIGALPVATPEPSTALFTLLGIAGFVLLRLKLSESNT